MVSEFRPLHTGLTWHKSIAHDLVMEVRILPIFFLGIGGFSIIL